MDKSKAYSVMKPFFGFLCGAHVPDMFKATSHDTFGLRDRVTGIFTRPTFATIDEIRAACDRLPVPDRTPWNFIASLCLPVLRWSLATPTLVMKPNPDDGAAAVCDRNFNQHVSMQEDTFLRPGLHNEAKYHGKLRTKFERLNLPLHVLDAVCKAWKAREAHLQQLVRENAEVVPAYALSGEWCSNFSADPIVAKTVITFAHKFADHCEHIWKVLDFARKGHTLLADDEMDSIPFSPVAMPPLPPVALAQCLITLQGEAVWKKEDLEKFLKPEFRGHIVVTFLSTLPSGNITVEILRTMMSMVLQNAGAWTSWSVDGVDVKAKRIATAVNKDFAFGLLFVACYCLDGLGLGRVVSSVYSSGGGRPIFLFNKRTIDDALAPVIERFGINNYSTPSLTAYNLSIDGTVMPARAQQPQWDALVTSGAIQSASNEHQRMLEKLFPPVVPGGQPPVVPAPVAQPAVAAPHHGAVGNVGDGFGG